ncbi:hypothetical protein LTR17_011098 [Elasticomyces elasticus]|nr:hypothetical protein LTR17_011098 [Elasticomyces elasticus]
MGPDLGQDLGQDDVEEDDVAVKEDLPAARILDDNDDTACTAAEVACKKGQAADANAASPSKTTESDQSMTSLEPESSVPDKAKVTPIMGQCGQCGKYIFVPVKDAVETCFHCRNSITDEATSVKPVMGQCSQCGKHIFVSAEDAVGTCFHCRSSITDEATSVTDEPPAMLANVVSLDPRLRKATRSKPEGVGVRRRLFPPSLPRGGASSSLEEALSTSIEPAAVQESAIPAKEVPRKAKRSFREDEEELRRDDQGLPATNDEVQFLSQRSLVPDDDDDDVVFVGRKSLPPAEVRERRIAAVVRREAAVWADGVPWPSPPPSPKCPHRKRLRIAHDEEVFREVGV